MTIERGVAWGEHIQTPSGVVSVHSDKELAECDPKDFVSLQSGDLFHALGSPQSVVGSSECILVHIDALQCRIDFQDKSSHVMAASSVVIGSWWSSSNYVCLTNGGMYDGLDLTPRAHPNDGKWDLFQLASTMGYRQRMIARRRSRTGSHLPHPHISVQRLSQFSFGRTSRGQCLRIDGVVVREWTSVHCQVLPDYWQVLL